MGNVGGGDMSDVLKVAAAAAGGIMVVTSGSGLGDDLMVLIAVGGDILVVTGAGRGVLVVPGAGGAGGGDNVGQLPNWMLWFQLRCGLRFVRSQGLLLISCK